MSDRGAVNNSIHSHYEDQLMKTLLTTLICLLSSTAFAEEPLTGIPNGYKLLYQQDFSDPKIAKDQFSFADPNAWRIRKVSGRTVLEQFQNAEYKPAVRSPINIAIIKGLQFNDFVMDVECQQTGIDTAHRDMVFVYGLQDPSHFYYTHIATKADDHANQCFIVDNKPRVKISKTSTDGTDWGREWRHVRVIHRAGDGVTEIYFEDMSKPIMTAKDKTFGSGWVGLGTFDDSCMIRKITIHGDRAIDKKFSGFKK